MKRVFEKLTNITNEIRIKADTTELLSLDEMATAIDSISVGDVCTHVYSEWIDQVDATCGQDGTLGHYECTNCNRYFDADYTEIYDLSIPASEHTYESIVTEPTCTEDGYSGDTYCNDCKSTIKYGEEIPKGHTEGSITKENEVAATCEKGGSYDNVTRCTVCGIATSIETVTTQASGHNWGEWTTTKEATCTATGTKQRTCKNDSSHVETETIPAKGHTEGDEATCTTPQICAVCEVELVEALGHTTDSGTCTRCGNYIGGCVFAGTQIALDENTNIDIVDFVGGTPIDFCNPSTLEHSTQQTLARFFYEKATQKVTLTLEDGKTIALTPNHAVLTDEGLKVYLNDYTFPKYEVGDSIATVDGYKELVSIQEETINETTVYNIATENSLMVANGIIVAGELEYSVDATAVGGGDIIKGEGRV